MSDEPPKGRRAASTRPPGRKPRSEGSSEDTRRDLLRHAVRLFNERGFAAVSLDDVARAAGVNRGTLYYHFKGKEDVFLTAFERVMALVREETGEIVARDDLTVRQRLALIVRRRTETRTQDQSERIDAMDDAMVRAAMGHVGPEGHRRLGAQFGAVHGQTMALIAEGIALGELPPLPPSVLDFAFWALFPPEEYPAYLGLERAEIEEMLLRVFFCEEPPSPDLTRPGDN